MGTRISVRTSLSAAAALASLALAACGGGGDSASSATTNGTTTGGTGTTAGNDTSTTTRLSIGEAMFNDTSLSASGKLACATCHAKATGHADPVGTLLPLGGIAMDRQGFRSSPTLRYLSANGAFRFDNGKPVGGFTWDGRADSREAQAGAPLLDAREMANADASDVAAKLRRAAYFADFTRLYALPSTATDSQVFDAAKLALATYQAGDSDFTLFNSKFDQVLDGKATFTAQEARGQAAFNDPARGNCASCHTSRVTPDGSRPLFTNFTYAALGLPRNNAIGDNADPSFFDMGLCGPKRTDLADRLDLCGMFKVPTLRNVAITAPYFHNASVSTLEEAVSFYATRDLDPARWYPIVNGRPDTFNDLPSALRGNVLRTAPFGQAPGGGPRITAQDTADIAAFLRTLTDDITAPANSPTVAP